MNMPILLVARYEQYDRAIGERRGPNWLWPLSHYMLNNLRQEETKDPVAMMDLAAIFTSLMQVLPEMMAKYEVTEDWN